MGIIMNGQKLWMYLLVLGLALLVGVMLIRIGLGGKVPEETKVVVEPTPALIGGDKDEGGCLIGAGYSWCEALGQCVRPWETPCEAATPEATESGNR